MLTEEQGVQAIIELQLFAGIVEPPERALSEWRKMSEHDKQNTEAAHETMFGGFE